MFKNRKNPKTLVIDAPALLPNCFSLVMMSAADVLILDPYCCYDDYDNISTALLGIGSDDIVEFTPPMEVVDLNHSGVFTPRSNLDRKLPLHDIEILGNYPESNESIYDVLRKKLEQSYGHLPFFDDYCDIYMRHVEQALTWYDLQIVDRYAMLCPSGKDEMWTSASKFNTYLLQKIFHDVLNKELEFAVAPVIPHQYMESGRRTLQLIHWAKRHYPSLKYLLIGENNYSEVIFNGAFYEVIEENTALEVIGMRYDPPEGFRYTSAMGLLMQNGKSTDVSGNLNLTSMSFHSMLSGDVIELREAENMAF